MLRTLTLLCLALVGFSAETTTTITGTLGVAVPSNVQFATASAEATVIVNVTAGHPMTYEFNCDGGGDTSKAQAWYFRTTLGDATTEKFVAGNQALKLRFTKSTTFYVLRSTADGVVTATSLLQE